MDKKGKGRLCKKIQFSGWLVYIRIPYQISPVSPQPIQVKTKLGWYEMYRVELRGDNFKQNTRYTNKRVVLTCLPYM